MARRWVMGSTARVIHRGARWRVSAHVRWQWNQRGHDITHESLMFGDRPKIILQSFAPSGFDVQNSVKNVDRTIESDGSVHYHSSIITFPFACFLWNIKTLDDVSVKSLSPTLLHRPKLEYLFLGIPNGRIDKKKFESIASEFRAHGIVVEQMELSNAIGTFNVLNAEDRPVAAALLMDNNES